VLFDQVIYQVTRATRLVTQLQVILSLMI